MSNPKFPNAAPKRMNGMASLMAQARPLSPGTAAAAQAALQAAAQGPTAADAKAAVMELAQRVMLAEHRLELVAQVAANFRKQAAKLDPADPVRQTADAMISTFESCCSATLTVQLQEENHAPDAGSQGPG